MLCYHALSTSWPAAQSIHPERLRAQLTHLLSHGYRPVTFEEAVDSGNAGRYLAITFDDAYQSVFTLARPILAELGVPATLFVATDVVERGGPARWSGVEEWLGGSFESELHVMGWEQIAQLADEGWEIGSHSRSHRHLSRCTDEELEDEALGSRATLEQRLRRPCRSFAYPFGDVNARVLSAVRRAGYSAAATIPQRFVDSDPLLWPRVSIWQHDGGRGDLRFRVKVSRSVRSLRASPVGRLLAFRDARLNARRRGR